MVSWRSGIVFQSFKLPCSPLSGQKMLFIGLFVYILADFSLQVTSENAKGKLINSLFILIRFFTFLLFLNLLLLRLWNISKD